MNLSSAITTSCLLEVIAPKPGNVHRGADFEDLTFADFALSAAAIGPAISENLAISTGELILKSIEATRAVVNTNTNLGICLLLVPLAKSIVDGNIAQENVALTLANLDQADSHHVFSAIRLAASSSLGSVDQYDVSSEAPDDLIEAMELAEDRDLIARQYCRNFEDLFQFVIPQLKHQLDQEHDISLAIVLTHLNVMAEFPDSLIARKCGTDTAKKAAVLAAKTLESCERTPENREELIAELDFWLRSDGHRRNPGTTADMICAAIFVCLINGDIRFPR